MNTFTVSNKGCIERADGVAQYVAEASSLGLPVGSFPLCIVVPGFDTFMRRGICRDREGSVTVVRYQGQGFARLSVWND